MNALISDCERALREENFLAICRMHYVLKELATPDVFFALDA